MPGCAPPTDVRVYRPRTPVPASAQRGSGYIVTWTADILTRPDIEDIAPHLQRFVDHLATQPAIADATCTHDRHAATVAVAIHLSVALPLDLTLANSRRALVTSLEQNGLSTVDRTPQPPARLALRHYNIS